MKIGPIFPSSLLLAPAGANRGSYTEYVYEYERGHTEHEQNRIQNEMKTRNKGLVAG